MKQFCTAKKQKVVNKLAYYIVSFTINFLEVLFMKDIFVTVQYTKNIEENK